MRRSFTLIELLIVIGILSILVVTILVTLNPAEAQKKARDTQRLKDVAVLQAILEQYINDGRPPLCENRCDSSYAGTHCSSSWIRIPTSQGGANVDLCNYTKTIPTDPRKGNYTQVVNGGTISNPTTDIYGPAYLIKMQGSDYEINFMQESKSNAKNVLNIGDGGNSDYLGEVGSKLDLLAN